MVLLCSSYGTSAGTQAKAIYFPSFLSLLYLVPLYGYIYDFHYAIAYMF